MNKISYQIGNLDREIETTKKKKKKEKEPNGLVIPQEVTYRITVCSSNPTPGYITKRIKSRDLNRCVYANVHSNIIHNSQKVEINQVFINI